MSQINEKNLLKNLKEDEMKKMLLALKKNDIPNTWNIYE